MKKKTLWTIAASTAAVSMAAFLVVGDRFVASSMNTDRLRNKGNKTLRKNKHNDELPPYTPGIRCQDPGQWSDDHQNYDDLYLYEGKLLLHSRLYRNEGHDYIIFHHGYTSNLTLTGPMVHKLHQHGYNVLGIEPRGHGKSQGHYTSMGWYEKDDVKRWIDYINEIDHEARIVLYGISMGASTVMLTLGEQLPDNVVCAVEDCGYSTLWREYIYQCVTTVHYPFSVVVAGNLMTRLKLGFTYGKVNCLKALRKNRRPLLLIHGTHDTFVPFGMLQQNYEANAGEKEKLEVEGATHARSSSKDPELYWNTFFAFVDRYLQKEEA